jgi:hypothetical protein
MPKCAAKAAIGGKYVFVNAYFKKEEISQVNGPSTMVRY